MSSSTPARIASASTGLPLLLEHAGSLRLVALAASLFAFAAFAPACELCAVYNATSASGQSQSGWLLSISEQFIPFRTLQFNGREVNQANPDYLDSSLTHIVPTYNFSARLGISANLPVVYRSFKRSEVRYSTTGPAQFRTERDDLLDIGDLSLIVRWAAWEKSGDGYGLLVNLLGGVKLPTGDTDRIRDEVDQTRIYESLLPPNTPHDPLGHSVSGIHQHDLSPGSGSVDGVFGIVMNSRWRRAFFNSQIQYYLRTEGTATYEMGDELMISGGPGAYLFLEDDYTVSLQALAVYDTMARSTVLGRKTDYTGSTAWYLGPLVSVTLGDRISANAGADIPIRITNNQFQNVPDFRFHAGISCRF